MQWVRVLSDPFTGQTRLVGAAWDPLLYFVLAGVAVAVLHALYKLLTRGKPDTAAEI